ncbi:YgiT-type zinc finger protein [Desulforamulus ruminis]|uniref:YgiT-type zinc finger domain-containing protein n=1 Tax=Desulforamulus ruminis (strain ATCC 23193 / DSM 2154 / NCIMB 8452 / DL) TaxID=696281 RepID=F6DKH5_DESRL|nr:YgiT-type zinc finger protein [Desulforamulus ruminis]AEG59235.1 hypothetical protein Desru_0959 [Desulforamulus ruminis DSM 2154]
MKDGCPKCGGIMNKKKVTAEYSTGGKSGHVPVTYWECQSCGEQYFDAEALKRLLGSSESQDHQEENPFKTN